MAALAKSSFKLLNAVTKLLANNLSRTKSNIDRQTDKQKESSSQHYN